MKKNLWESFSIADIILYARQVELAYYPAYGSGSVYIINAISKTNYFVFIVLLFQNEREQFVQISGLMRLVMSS